MKTIFGTVKNSTDFLRNILCGLVLATVCVLSAQSARAACTTQAGFTTDPDVTINNFTMNPKNISATVVTTCGGTGCTNPPTLVGGTIRLDLCLNGEVKYTGMGNIAPGPGTQSQNVTVSVPITPKVPGTYKVVRTVVANFSDGSTSSYSFDCNGNPVSLRTVKKAAAAKKPAAAAKKK